MPLVFNASSPRLSGNTVKAARPWRARGVRAGVAVLLACAGGVLWAASLPAEREREETKQQALARAQQVQHTFLSCVVAQAHTQKQDTSPRSVVEKVGLALDGCDALLAKYRAQIALYYFAIDPSDYLGQVRAAVAQLESEAQSRSEDVLGR